MSAATLMARRPGQLASAPTPAEIARGCAKIQGEWSTTERHHRRVRLCDLQALIDIIDGSADQASDHAA